MNRNYILSLDDETATLGNVGGKGASLARLATAELPVPGGFYVTTAAYDRFVAVNKLTSSIAVQLERVDPGKPETLESVSAAIRGFFSEAQIPPEIAGDIVAAYHELPDRAPAVAVRSSATAEDLPDLSFAGQQDSYLNVRGAEDLLRAVKRCWASLWTARAIGYRVRNKIDQESVSLAVVVQLLVPAETAGILFTANPISGRREEAMISAAWGLGEAIVGGHVTPDTIVVHKSEETVLSRETADKRTMTVRVNGGTREMPVSDLLRRAPAIDDETVLDLVKLGVEIESLYGMPMDIEWALSDGQLAIVQARPITTLPPQIEWTVPDPDSRYMRTSIVDLMPDPLSPLFATLGLSAINRGIYEMSKDMFNLTDDLIGELLITINGYAYEHVHWSGGELVKLVLKMAPRVPYMLREGVNYWQNTAHPRYAAVTKAWSDKPTEELSGRQLLQGCYEVLDAFAFHIGSLMASTMGPSAGSEGLFTKVYEKVVKRQGDPEASAFLMGFDNAPLLNEKALYDLALWCRERPDLASYLERTSAERLAQGFVQDQAPDAVSAEIWDEWCQRFDDYLKKHGYAIYDMDFMKPLPMDQPEVLLMTLKLYLNEERNPYERQRDFSERREQAMEIANSRVRRGLRKWAFEKALNWAQKQAPLREDGIAEIGLGFPALRRMLLELGGRIVTVGMIEESQDVFWLEQNELEQAVSSIEQSEPLADMRATISERKSFWESAKKVTPPPQLPQTADNKYLGFSTDLFLAHGEQIGDTIKGIGASPGAVTAPACVLHGPEDFDQMKPGYALVAGITTPAWTPLFTMASAVVTDIGGPLSHGSIVAREYGIPAVLGTGVATRKIVTGQIITVNGTTGEVLLSPNGDEAA